MTAQELKRGQKVQNQEGQTETVFEVVGGMFIRTYENFSQVQKCTTLTINGKRIEA